MRPFFFFSLTFFLLLACSSGYLIDMKETTNYPEGRTLYASKCSGCHNYYDPLSFTSAKWDSILIPMQKKAKLTDEERESILFWINEKRNKAVSIENKPK